MKIIKYRFNRLNSAATWFFLVPHLSARANLYTLTIVNVSPTTTLNNVVNGLPVVRFDGTNKYLILPTNLLSEATAAEAFVVLKTAFNNPSSHQSLWEMGGNPLGVKSFPDTDGSIKDDFGSTSVLPVGTPTEPLNQFNVYEVSSQPDNWSAWLDGVLLYQTNVNTVQFPTTGEVGPPYTLGRSIYYDRVAAWTCYFAGDIAEVLVFNRALTISERALLNGYLNFKYGLVPEVTIVDPTNNAVFATGSNIGLSASAFEPGGGTIKQVEFFQGSTSLGVSTSSPYSITWNSVAAGSLTTNLYVLTARATGDNGMVATSAVVNIMVDPPPTVSITNPANGTYFGIAPVNISIGATASDITGIRQIQFFQGTTSLGVETSPPYGLVWSNVPPGNYSLTAVATGNDGLSTTSSVVNVIVDADTDGDGLGDLQEYLYGTNPNVLDGFWLWVSAPSGLSGNP